jgi:hypothetical protein
MVALNAYVISDINPNISLWRAQQAMWGKDKLDYIEQKTSAINIEQNDFSHWSIFTALHHFPPQDVRKLLTQFVQKGDSLCIVELTTRHWVDLISMFLSLPSHLMVPFFSNKFKWSKFIFTTIIPLVPFMVWFDGIVSELRSYTKVEIVNLLPSGWEQDFDITYKEVWWRFAPGHATMLLIVRKNTSVRSLSDLAD